MKNLVAQTYREDRYFPEICGQFHRFFFSNGYGASVIRGYGTYGALFGFWELAVLRGDVRSFEVCYDTEVTSDVIGWLTWEEAMEFVKKISELEGDSE